MNVTFDDTDPYLQFSPQWRVQPQPDPNFLQDTYHACQEPGCSFSLTFQGAGIYLYGSVGPNYGNYSVTVDGRILFMTANAPKTRYQQLLFGMPLRNGGYTIVYNNTSTYPAWLDLDYFTLTQVLNGVSPQSNPGSYESTVGPPQSASIPISAYTNSPSPSSTSTSASTSSTLLFGLTIAFGALILLLLIGVLVFFFLGRRRRTRRKAEMDFRVGGRGTPAALSHTTHGGTIYSSQPYTPAPIPVAMPMRTFSPTSRGEGFSPISRGEGFSPTSRGERAQSPRAGATSPSVVLISRDESAPPSELAYMSDRGGGTPDSTLRGKGKEWAGSRARGTRVFPGGASSPIPAPIVRRGAESIRTAVVMDDDADS